MSERHPNSLANLKKGHDWTKRGPAVKVNALSFGLMLKYMIEHPNCNNHEIAEHTGLHYGTVGKWLRAWHKLGIVHISAWDNNAYGRPRIKLYTFGAGKDVKPRIKSSREIARDYRARRKLREMHNAIAGRIESEPEREAG
jgi:hypothetical protein